MNAKMSDFQDISIALAGVCQSAALVHQFAHKGFVNQDDFRISLMSLSKREPETLLDVFGNDLSHLNLGLETLLAQLGGNKGQIDGEISRYWLGSLALSQKLDKNPDAKLELSHRLNLLERQLPLYDNDILHEQMIANIASIYSDIISPLGGRIQVFGREDLLTRTDIQNRVRAALLAGIRASILWQQVGGSKWQFLFSRKKLLKATQSLYSLR